MSKKTSDATKAWLEGLKNTGAISEEIWKVLEDASSKEEFVNYVGETAMMRQDYSRNLDRVQAEYQAKTNELTDYQRQLADWRGKTEKEVTQIQAEANQLKIERQRLVAVAQSYGLTEEDLGQSVAPFTSNPNLTLNQNRDSDPQDKINPKDYLSRSEAEELGTMYTLLPAEINDIVAEHVELFGKQPRGMRQIVERAIKEKRPLRDVYEDEFKVSDRKSEIAEQQKEAEIKRRVEEEITRYRTDHPEVRIPLPNSSRSYVLNNKIELPDNVENLASDQRSSVSAAVAHWNQMEHKSE